jgi:hypothetical protein
MKFMQKIDIMRIKGLASKDFSDYLDQNTQNFEILVTKCQTAKISLVCMYIRVDRFLFFASLIMDSAEKLP